MKQCLKRNIDPVYSAFAHLKRRKSFDSVLPSQFQYGPTAKTFMSSGAIEPTEVHLKRCPMEPNTSCCQKGDEDDGIMKFLSGETGGMPLRKRGLDLEPCQYEQG